MSNEAIETHVQTRIAPAHQPIVVSLRELMRRHAPEATEVIMYGSLAWKARKALAIISASKTHLTFAFERGAEFTDAHGLLDGVGKKTRHVKLKKLDDVDEAALSDYIAQAVRLDQA